MSSEIFVGNTPTSAGIPPHLSSLRTVRLGDVAHDIHGKKLDGYRPMLVCRSEAGAYDRIMMARFSAVSNGRTVPA